ncbi:MAG: helix-turn-helix domain-containing protein [Thermoanaerobaculia bacterium]
MRDVLFRMDTSVAFVGSGAAVGIVLGSSILVTRRSGLREQRWLALMLIGVSAAMIAITLRHASSRLAGEALLDLVEYVTALASGPLFAGYMRSRLRGELAMHPSLLAHFLPAGVVALQIVVSGEAVVPFRFVMLVQFAYTAVALRETVAAYRSGVAAERLRWPTRLAGFVVLIHVAQVIRTLFFDVPQLRNVVPITAVVGLEVLAILGVREAVMNAAALAPGFPARARVSSYDDAALLEVLDAAMLRERPWADPDLSLERLARVAGSTPHRVSSALNAEREGFFEFVSSWRLDAVRAALEDPANDIYTIEALAENAGFRSRSTFYSSFRRKFGITPSQVRKRP